jgi:arylsulfatase A-like enzyme
MWAIRHGDWKLVHGEAGTTPPELFDLAADVAEEHDLANDQSAKVQELKTMWDAWNAEQASPKDPKHKDAKKGKKKKARRASQSTKAESA